LQRIKGSSAKTVLLSSFTRFSERNLALNIWTVVFKIAP
jgi:hypothetical protein